MLDFVSSARGAVPLEAITASAYPAWLARQTAMRRNWLADFRPEAGTHRRLPDQEGDNAVLIILADQPGLWDLAGLPYTLPEGTYRLTTTQPAPIATRLALGWALGSYRFNTFKKPERSPARLVWPEHADRAEVIAIAEAIRRGRTLINTPAETLGPAELEEAVRDVAKTQDASIRCYVGDALLRHNFPLIHAVGRASTRQPRLIDLRWGDPQHPHVTLVGKGVCFDTGGLDLKPSSGMLLMRKDMGGAASALALAEMVMRLQLKIRLRLLIPAVENAVSGNAYRPGDIFRARNGTTIEIGNTDAEGRLILADTLALAVEEKPDLLLDFATLTGAARTALGTGLPALFCNDDALAAALLVAGNDQQDPLWRMPLHSDYRAELKSPFADLNSAPQSPYAGAITAALFLDCFVGATRWAHIDMMGWHLSAKPGRPVGGEPMAARAVLGVLRHGEIFAAAARSRHAHPPRRRVKPTRP